MEAVKKDGRYERKEGRGKKREGKEDKDGVLYRVADRGVGKGRRRDKGGGC